MHRSAIPALLCSLLGCGAPASADLLGASFLFECAECTPATADDFVGKPGPADYSLKFDGYTWREIDIEASTISIKTVMEGYTRSPLFFRLTWSPAEYTLLNATISPASTFTTSYSCGPGELVVDMGGQYFAQGSQITFDLTAAPVPEPTASWLLALGAAVLLWRQRHALPTLASHSDGPTAACRASTRSASRPC